MFETNESYAGMVEAVYSLVTSRRRGQDITHDEIRRIVGCEPQAAHWNTIMDRVRDKSEKERGTTITSIRDVGYHLCTVEEQFGEQPRRLRKATRQLRKGERSLKVLARVSGLTTTQRHRQSLAVAGLERHRRELVAETKVAAVIARPHTGNPRYIPMMATTTQDQTAPA